MKRSLQQFGLAIALFVLFVTYIATLRGDGNAGGYFAFAMLMCIAGFIYLAPSILAFGKRHPRRHLVLVLNLLLAWLLIPWIAEVLWVLRQTDRRHER